MWIKDTKGEKSATLTITVATVGIALLKLLLSGMEVKGINFGDFSGTDFAAVVTPVFGLYWGRRNMTIGKDKEEK